MGHEKDHPVEVLFAEYLDRTAKDEGQNFLNGIASVAVSVADSTYTEHAEILAKKLHVDAKYVCNWHAGSKTLNDGVAKAAATVDVADNVNLKATIATCKELRKCCAETRSILSPDLPMPLKENDKADNLEKSAEVLRFTIVVLNEGSQSH